MTTTHPERIVIVGGGLAAAEAAATLRSEGFEGAVTIVGDEQRAPYERPALSKDYLRGETDESKLLAREAGFYDRHRIELISGTQVVDIRTDRRHAVVADGRTLPYDALLLATGASPRQPAGFDSAGGRIHVLRTVRDAARLREAAAGASHAVVAGGGWIAAEVAASLRQMGLEITLAIPGRHVLGRSLGPEVGAIYTALHRDHGVDLATDARVASVDDSPAGPAVVLTNGARLAGDLVVLGFGASPNVGLARRAGLEIDDGIVTDAYLQASAPGIFAAGDVASAWHPRYATRVRSEHVENARRQGAAAARNMLGRSEPYKLMPFFYSDQYELGMEYVGRSEGADEVVVRRFAEDAAFLAFWLRGGAIVAAMHGNTWEAREPLERLVAAGAVVDRGRLADPALPLEELAEPAAAPVG